MVVDDDHDLADALCEWITLSSDWDAVAAYGPAEAVARATSSHPDAILLDMEMDGADGFETAGLLTLTSASSPPTLLALTGNAWLRDAASVDPRFAGSMLKPADLRGLIGLLERATSPH